MPRAASRRWRSSRRRGSEGRETTKCGARREICLGEKCDNLAHAKAKRGIYQHLLELNTEYPPPPRP